MRKESSVPTRNSLNESLFITKTSHYGIQPIGAGMVIARPAASHVHLAHMTFLFTTDANVANRMVTVSLELAAHSIVLGSSQMRHAAGLGQRYICSPCPIQNAGSADFYWSLPLPYIRSVKAGDTYAININNVQAGDQLNFIDCYWRVWRGLS